jgi:hypothetical protein
MYIVPIAWLYVAFMMAVAEATNSTGSVLGAVVTFVLYGLVPVLLVVYLMATPARKRAIRARELQDLLQQQEPGTVETAASAARSTQPNAGGHASTASQADGIAPVRKEP